MDHKLSTPTWGMGVMQIKSVFSAEQEEAPLCIQWAVFGVHMLLWGLVQPRPRWGHFCSSSGI